MTTTPEETGAWPEVHRPGNEVGKHRRSIWYLVESEVRRKFGHKRVAEARTNETILYSIVKKLSSFNGCATTTARRFSQHFKAVKHRGGEGGLV